MKPGGTARAVYRFGAAPLMLAGYRAASLFNGKAREFFRLRRGMFERLSGELAKLEPRAHGLVMVHVASVGELLEALPVMKAIKERTEGPALLLSYTSPSVHHHLPREAPFDIITPSPLDTYSSAGKFLDLAAPDLIVFSSYDLWPNLVFAAGERGIELALINARLHDRAGRLRVPARWLFREVAAGLSAVGAVNQESAQNFTALGVPASRVSVAGNCRFDQTLARCGEVRADDPALAPLPRLPFLLIAGSTWPEDHRRLLPALARLLGSRPELGAVIAPHEPTPKRVAELEDFFRRRDMACERYTELVKSGRRCEAPALVVDTIGVLYKLYRAGSAAYVGGGFRQGVHNVMEPAGMSLPVLIGPVHQNSAEAVEMVKRGGAVSAGDAEHLESALAAWIDAPEARARAGAAALAVVERNAGATSRSLALLGPQLEAVSQGRVHAPEKTGEGEDA